MRPPPPSSALQLLVLNLPSLGQLDIVTTFACKKLSTSGPSALPFSSPSSSRPSFNNCLHLSRRTSPFRKLHHKTSSRFPQTASTLLSFPTKTSRKREKAMLLSAVSTHTHLSHTQTALLHFLRQLDLFVQTLAIRSLST
jgi:hypothetical protein